MNIWGEKKLQEFMENIKKKKEEENTSALVLL